MAAADLHVDVGVSIVWSNRAGLAAIRRAINSARLLEPQLPASRLVRTIVQDLETAAEHITVSTGQGAE